MGKEELEKLDMGLKQRFPSLGQLPTPPMAHPAPMRPPAREETHEAFVPANAGEGQDSAQARGTKHVAYAFDRRSIRKQTCPILALLLFDQHEVDHPINLGGEHMASGMHIAA